MLERLFLAGEEENENDDLRSEKRRRRVSCRSFEVFLEL
jgi:hypothetical protein